MRIRRIVAVAALCGAGMVSAGVAGVAPVSAAAGDGLRVTDMNTCIGNDIDATTGSWSWTKPSLEFSTDNGATYSSAAGSQWAVAVCRRISPVKQYWFVIGPSNLNSPLKDMGAAGLAAGLQFKVTIPTKSGDSVTYAAGYSSMVSFVEQSGSAVIQVKPAGLSKINLGMSQGADPLADFKVRHPECASVTMQTWNKCSIEKADEDIVASVIQHVGFVEGQLTAMDETMKGLWVGANVNGFQIGMSCASPASSRGVRSAEDITVGGKTYTRLPDGKFRGPDGTTYTESELAALMMGGGGSGGSSEPSLSVTMEDTPHLKADGTVNKGSMKMFIPSAIATKCFGNSTTTLAQIAEKLTLTRTEDKEGTSIPVFTAVAVTSPAAGVIVSVAEMTFSNPNYTLKSLLRAASAGNTTGTNNSTTTTAPATTSTPAGNQNPTDFAASPAAGSPSGDATAGAVASTVAKIAISGKRAVISVKMAKAGTIKIYSKIGTKIRLVKTVKAKAGNNSTTVTYTKGAVFTVRSATGKVIATLK